MLAAVLRLIVGVLLELQLRLLRELARLRYDRGEVDGHVDLHTLQARIIRLLQMVSHDDGIEQVASAAKQIRRLRDVRHRGSSQSIKQRARRHLLVRLGHGGDEVAVLARVVLVQ